jgi:hypothetical protein
VNNEPFDDPYLSWALQPADRAARDDGSPSPAQQALASDAAVFEDLSRGLATGIPRRRVVALLGLAAVTEVLAGLGVGRSRAQGSDPAGQWVIRVGAPSANCGGCTSGGTTCFAQNSCGSACLEERTLDCMFALVSAKVCCPSCNGEKCKPNIPCSGSKPRPNTIVSDTCPAVGSAPRECQYYARRDASLGGRCKYYRIEAPKQCKSPPMTTSGLSPDELACIRQCLQVSDTQLGPGDKTSTGCTKVDPIVIYHESCFASCGVSENRFPRRLFKWFGDHDGN